MWRSTSAITRSSVQNGAIPISEQPGGALREHPRKSPEQRREVLLRTEATGGDEDGDSVVEPRVVDQAPRLLLELGRHDRIEDDAHPSDVETHGAGEVVDEHVEGVDGVAPQACRSGHGGPLAEPPFAADRA